MPAGSRGKWIGVLFRLTGDKELEQQLIALPHRWQNRVARPAIAAAMRVIMKAQKAAAPSRLQKDAIGMRMGKRGGGYERSIEIKVGIGVGKRKKSKVAAKQDRLQKHQALGAIYTLGTKDRFIRGRGLLGRTRATQRRMANRKYGYRGRMLGHKFLYDATVAAWPQAVQAAADVARLKLETVMALQAANKS